jgi:hypothetical protein
MGLPAFDLSPSATVWAALAALYLVPMFSLALAVRLTLGRSHR